MVFALSGSKKGIIKEAASPLALCLCECINELIFQKKGCRFAA